MKAVVTRRRVPALASVLVVLAAMAGASGVPGTTALALTGTYTNPVIASDSADPFIYKNASTYYEFNTNDGVSNIPVRSSTDLVHWSAETDALPTMPSWANAGLTWAPSVLKQDTGFGPLFVLYFTAQDKASGKQCIGTASVGWAPAGPYVPASTSLVCDGNDGDIDASPIRDQSGNATLFWKEGLANVGSGAQIRSRMLDHSDPTIFLAGTSPVVMLTGQAGFEVGQIEAPSVTYDPGSGKYIMFYAANWWDQIYYATGWATCAQVSGKFSSCTRGTTHQPLLSYTNAVKGPGGVETWTDNLGKRWLVYHGHTAAQCGVQFCSGGRSMRIDHLTFSAAGVPATPGPTHTVQNF